MNFIFNFIKFNESQSFKDTVKILRDDNLHVDYEFEDHLGNKFLVQFKNITHNGRLSKEYNFSYFVWDVDIDNWSVSKEIDSNPFRIVRTVLGDILNDFINRKRWCVRIYFEGLSKESQRGYISQRTKLYLRFLEQNPVNGFNMSNYGNKFILTRK
jgi:hypothetical protein